MWDFYDLRHQDKKLTKGFTIIEVLIVLAIAGLILLILFLAVPALKRQVRNKQRISDGQTVVIAVEECLQNNKLNTNACRTIAAINLDVSKFQIFTDSCYDNEPSLPTFDPTLRLCGGPAYIDGPVWFFHTICINNKAIPNGVNQSFIVSFLIEGTVVCLNG